MKYNFGNYIKNKERCFYCGISAESAGRMTKDHFYPKSKKGRQIVYSCIACNQLKSDMTPENFVYFLLDNKKIEKEKRDRMVRATLSLMYIVNIDESIFNPDFISKGLAMEVCDLIFAKKMADKYEAELIETKKGTYIILIEFK